MNFKRLVRLEIKIRNEDFTGYTDLITIRDLRISFSIQKTQAWATNTASINIWNLSSDKRNIIKDYGDEISLYAGYEFDAGEKLLFIGDTTKVAHIFSQPDIITSLECGDGERILNQKLISVSFGSKIPVREVIQKIAEEMGLSISYFAPSDNIIYQYGDSFVGLGKNGLDKACAALNLQWSVQNRDLIIIPNKGFMERPAYIINEDTGMIGTPERFTYKDKDLFTGGPKTGWRVRTVLKPEIIPGDRMDIKSNRVEMKGPFGANAIAHQGDTFGPMWSSNFEVVLV